MQLTGGSNWQPSNEDTGTTMLTKEELQNRLVIIVPIEHGARPSQYGTTQAWSSVEVIDGMTGLTLNPSMHCWSVLADNLRQHPVGTGAVGRFTHKRNHDKGTQWWIFEVSRSDLDMDHARRALDKREPADAPNDGDTSKAPF